MQIMFGSIKKIFTELLTGLANGSNHTMCVSLSNQINIIQPILINLYPNEYSQEFHYHLSVFNMITGINEWKTLTKHKLCECKCKFDGTLFNSNQWCYNNKCLC